MLTSLALRWPRERGPITGEDGYELSMKTPPWDWTTSAIESKQGDLVRQTHGQGELAAMRGGADAGQGGRRDVWQRAPWFQWACETTVATVRFLQNDQEHEHADTENAERKIKCSQPTYGYVYAHVVVLLLKAMFIWQKADITFKILIFEDRTQKKIIEAEYQNRIQIQQFADMSNVI